MLHFLVRKKGKNNGKIQGTKIVKFHDQSQNSMTFLNLFMLHDHFLNRVFSSQWESCGTTHNDSALYLILEENSLRDTKKDQVRHL